MRPAIFVAAVLACAAIAPDTTRSALASAAAVIIESLPFLVASAILARVARRFAPTIVAYAGCGCATGPGARSIPAAFATALLFGPWIALARWLAAVICSLTIARDADHDAHAHAPVLDDLVRLIPSAILSGAIVTIAPAIDIAHKSALIQAAIGAVIGIAGSPCAFGGVAVAAALHAQSPLACGVVLAVSGIADLGVWYKPRTPHIYADRMSYASVALACALVAAEHGAALVHPRLEPALWASALYCSFRAIRAPWERAHRQQLVACALVAACIFGSPAPPQTATETTLDDVFAGERLDFTGRYVERYGIAHIVRYAITCCRADARPVGIRLVRRYPTMGGDWIRAKGVLRQTRDGFELAPAALSRVVPPTDPFIYR